MKKSKVETAKTRSRIVKTAAREFRRKGIQATGLAEVMAAAGLTHGGFYRHFGSKDQLVAEACAVAMEFVVAEAEAAVCRSEGKGELETIIESYLTINHRDDRSGGCPLAGLGSELSRANGEIRAAVSAGLLKFTELLENELRRRRPGAAKSDALFALSAMVGAVTLSRIVTDPDLSTAIIRDTKRHLTLSCPSTGALRDRSSPGLARNRGSNSSRSKKSI